MSAVINLEARRLEQIQASIAACGSCKHFSNEDAEGWGECSHFDNGSHCSYGCRQWRPKR